MENPVGEADALLSLSGFHSTHTIWGNERMNDEHKQLRYESIDELFVSASTSTIFDDVEAAILEKRANSLSDQDEGRQQEAWSSVAGKVVGHEGE